MKDSLVKKCFAYLICAFLTCLMIKYLVFTKISCGTYETARCLNINVTENHAIGWH